GIEFSWNVLDFGLSYYRANQQADQVLIAEERRRRVTQMIAQDVRSAYWRAVGAQRLQKQTEQLIERTRAGLERSRQAERAGLMPPATALNYQRQLLDALDVLANRRQELNYAKRELAALMNVPPGITFELVADQEPALAAVPTNLNDLELMALMQRSELREQDYEKRITENERRRQLLALLPNLNFTTGPQYDSNRYLFNRQWVDSNIQISVNLLRLLAIPSINKTQAAQLELNDARRRALAMAVKTQVRVAVERYSLAIQELEVARESSAVDQRLLNFSQANQVARTESELDLVRAEVRALNSDYQRYLAYASAQTAFGRMFNTLGVNVVPDNLQDLSIPALSQRLDGFLTTALSDTFPRIAEQPVKQLPRLSVNVELPAGASDPAAARASVRQALMRNQVAIQEEGKPAGAALNMRVDVAPSANGPRRVTAVISMLDAKGVEVGTSTYTSSLPSQPNARAINAFAEAAVVANLASLTGWLHKVAQ
ncbi:MAG: TolC family protein, partial [Hydrogenophaga sp.]|nr:TolC family protein [Hydrogenophaga sp.]